MAIQESSENPRVAIRKKRTKSAFIQIRVTESDREMIRVMAEKAEMTISDFVMSRVWGEVQVALKAEPTKQPAPKEVEVEKESVKPLMPRRDFEKNKPRRYKFHPTGEEWATVANDPETGQWFLVTKSGGITEGSSKEECLLALDAMQG